jgi:hypothetical protein
MLVLILAIMYGVGLGLAIFVASIYILQTKKFSSWKVVACVIGWPLFALKFLYEMAMLAHHERDDGL